MATLSFAKVYYQDTLAGYLQEEPGGHISFTYDRQYVSENHPAIAHTLPIQEAPHISHSTLHPFFDNLVAEGWLEQAQTRLLGKRDFSRFELLLAFGVDCAGAVSIIDPEPSDLKETLLDTEDPKEVAALRSRASLSGVQAKLPVVEHQGSFHPTAFKEPSTHIAKFSSLGHSDLIENEYLTTLIFKTLLPDDDVVDLCIHEVEGLEEPALLIKRFDRVKDPVDGHIKRVHFEEFNQLLELPSQAKYNAAYEDISKFIQETEGCLPTQNYILFRRILVGLLLGNTDMHLKNFAMFHTPQGLRLTPSYDQVAAALYNYTAIALALPNNIKDLRIGSLKAKHLIFLGQGFGQSPASIKIVVDDIQKNMEKAKQALSDSKIGSNNFKNNLIKFMEKRWNGTFALIGQTLSKKR